MTTALESAAIPAEQHPDPQTAPSGAKAFIESVKQSAPKAKSKGAKMAEVAKKAAKGVAKKAAKKVANKTAKAANKTAKAAKVPGAPRTGHQYTLVNEKMLPEKLSLQGVFIINALRSGPATKATIAAAAAKNPKAFPCTQPHDRAVGFYLSKFKNAGALDFVKG